MNNFDRREVLGQAGLATVGVVLGFELAASNAANARVTPRSLRETLVGAWELVSCIETDVQTGAEFLPMGEHPEGLILYSPDGFMSAQLSAIGRKPFASGDMYQGSAQDYTAAGMTYLAYSGRFFVDEARRIIEHEMFVSLFPNWRGQRQVRIVKLDGDELRLTTDQPHVFNGSLKMATITWRRAKPNL